MPVHPSEENTESNIFDKVAKGNPDSGASDHPLHAENDEPVKADAADHKSKGPAIPEKMPDVEGSKDELKARAADMNK